MRDDRERLSDVLEAIERVEKYAVRGCSALASDELLQTWVVHHLMIIGEACHALSGGFRAKHTAEVWALASGLRNVIVHEYFGIDLGVVWNVIERDLPMLKESTRHTGLRNLTPQNRAFTCKRSPSSEYSHSHGALRMPDSSASLRRDRQPHRGKNRFKGKKPQVAFPWASICNWSS
jgi:uncharacterized protein with HEPN domain